VTRQYEEFIFYHTRCNVIRDSAWLMFHILFNDDFSTAYITDL